MQTFIVTIKLRVNYVTRRIPKPTFCRQLVLTVPIHLLTPSFSELPQRLGVLLQYRFLEAKFP